MTKKEYEEYEAGKPRVGSARDLRKRAEEAARQIGTEEPSVLSIEGARRLIHELCVHQIELEMQNEELRRVQVALDSSRARYFGLYDLAPVGYVTLSEQGLILEANLRASTMLGTPKGALIKQRLTRFIVAEDQDTYYLHRKKLFETEAPQACELRMQHQDGSMLWVNLESTLAGDERSGEVACLTALTDITEQHVLRANLAQADRMASMGILAAGVAHEINNPLTSVLYNAESLAEDLPRLVQAVRRCRDALCERVGSDRLAEIIGEGVRMTEPVALADLTDRARNAAIGSQRIKEIAKGLSSFSRIEQGALSMVDLNQAVEQAISMASNEIKCRAMMVRDLGRVPRFLASEGSLAQVLLNLIVNAAHAIDEGAVEDNRVTVRTWAEASHVCVEVTDTGCGIPPQDLDKIFEPFFTTKAPDRGTGLGLAVVRRIVSELGGDSHVESTVGQGTRFVLRFPITQAKAVPSPPATPERLKTRGRILVVDDEKMVRETIKAILGPRHEVVTACSGREAKEILATDTCFDCILCDLMMSDIPGIELHGWLAENRPKLAQQLAFITGGVFTPQTRKYLDDIPNLVIGKPFKKREFETLVSGLVAASRNPR
jgi:PAS domain S-box-containing protein